MPYYSLFNHTNNRYLKHPKIGLWHTDNLEEAQDMLKDAHGYLDAVGLSHMKKDVVIQEIPEEEQKQIKVQLQYKDLAE